MSSPTFASDFIASSTIPTGFSFSRGSTGTFYNSSGVLSTATSGTPRFDYDPATHSPRGLLMEPAATNFVLYSTQIENTAANNYSFYFISSVYTTNATAAPDGSSTATKYAEDSSGNTDQHSFGVTYVSLPNNTTYTMSFFGKAGTITGFELVSYDSNGVYDSTNFELSGAGIVRHAPTQSFSKGYGIQKLANGWYRMYTTINAGSGSGTVGFGARLYDTVADTSYYNAGAGGRYAYVWGAQIEANPGPTSFIRTAASAVTRSADQLSTSSLGWYDSHVGTLFAQYVDAPNVSATGTHVFGLFGTNAAGTFTQNMASLIDNATTNLSAVNSGGSGQFISSGSLNASGTVNKISLAYAGQNFASSTNGVLSSSASTGSTPVASYAYVNSQPDGAQSARWIQSIKYYRQRLNNIDLKTLTQP